MHLTAVRGTNMPACTRRSKEHKGSGDKWAGCEKRHGTDHSGGHDPRVGGFPAQGRGACPMRVHKIRRFGMPCGRGGVCVFSGCGIAVVVI